MPSALLLRGVRRATHDIFHMHTSAIRQRHNNSEGDCTPPELLYQSRTIFVPNGGTDMIAYEEFCKMHNLIKYRYKEF